MEVTVDIEVVVVVVVGATLKHQYGSHKELCCGQVVQEYERAVIFRLGRLKQGGAKVSSGAQPSSRLIFLISLRAQEYFSSSPASTISDVSTSEQSPSTFLLKK